MDANEQKRAKHFEEMPYRQRAAATMLLYVSNMLTDFQLNPDFTIRSPQEKKLIAGLIECTACPFNFQDEGLKFTGKIQNVKQRENSVAHETKVKKS